MSYKVKEIYYTLQGEGMHSGRAAVFCRFTGCNLWSGREEDRHTAICQFCDTDFIGTDGPGGGKFETPKALALAVRSQWTGDGVPFVVCTGGEPLLQLDADLVGAFHKEGFEVGIETNGTIAAPPGVNHICVSPKSGSDLVLRGGHELKLVHPQAGISPADFEHMGFDCFFLQPMDGPLQKENTLSSISYCLANPKWRLSLQIHKIIGIE